MGCELAVGFIQHHLTVSPNATSKRSVYGHDFPLMVMTSFASAARAQTPSTKRRSEVAPSGESAMKAPLSWLSSPSRSLIDRPEVVAQ
jgi:hypothetical protein